MATVTAATAASAPINPDMLALNPEVTRVVEAYVTTFGADQVAPDEPKSTWRWAVDTLYSYLPGAEATHEVAIAPADPLMTRHVVVETVTTLQTELDASRVRSSDFVGSAPHALTEALQSIDVDPTSVRIIQSLIRHHPEIFVNPQPQVEREMLQAMTPMLISLMREAGYEDFSYENVSRFLQDSFAQMTGAHNYAELVQRMEDPGPATANMMTALGFRYDESGAIIYDEARITQIADALEMHDLRQQTPSIYGPFASRICTELETAVRRLRECMEDEVNPSIFRTEPDAATSIHFKYLTACPVTDDPIVLASFIKHCLHQYPEYFGIDAKGTHKDTQVLFATTAKMLRVAFAPVLAYIMRLDNSVEGLNKHGRGPEGDLPAFGPEHLKNVLNKISTSCGGGLYAGALAMGSDDPELLAPPVTLLTAMGVVTDYDARGQLVWDETIVEAFAGHIATCAAAQAALS